MSLKRFSWTEPALCHYDHDLKKSWFVFFDFSDNLTRTTVRKQFRGWINKIKSKEDRIKQGNALRLYWKSRLEEGWNPFSSDDDSVMKMPMHYSVVEGLDAITKIHVHSLKPRTKETYNYVVKLFKEWLKSQRLDNILLSKLDRSQCVQYMDWLVTDKGFSGRTHNDHLIILATLFNAMIARDWIIKNPCKGIKRRETSIGRNVAFNDREKEDLKALLKQKDPQLYYFTQIMYFTFIRRTELARLRIGDFDLHNKTIVIPANVSKNGKQESVVIPVGLEPILKEMKLHHYPAHHYVFGRHLLISDIIYKNVNHISTRHLKFSKKLEIDPSKSLYSWKHAGVCAAYYATGKDLYAILRQCRHKSIETTQIYLKSLGLIENDVFRNSMVA